MGALHDEFADTGWGIRQVDVPDREKLRLFLLSLLWRAAASSRPEFEEIELPASDLEQLRQLLALGGDPPQAFYPATLTQLSTLGVIHNHAPIAEIKRTPAVGTEDARDIPIFRFYFDGLIVHFHRHSEDDGYAEALGDLIVGASERLTVSTVAYEISFQQDNLVAVVSESIS